jgi:hypothetical protein
MKSSFNPDFAVAFYCGAELLAAIRGFPNSRLDVSIDTPASEIRSNLVFRLRISSPRHEANRKIRVVRKTKRPDRLDLDGGP